MRKWGLASFCNCEYSAHQQTADHIISAYPANRAPKGRRGQLILDEYIFAGSRTSLPSFDKTTSTTG